MEPQIQDWLTVRRSAVGGSELAALFDDVPEDCPYSSRWQLWADKRGMLPRRPETDPMKWGKRHEAAITAAVAEDWGVVVQDWATVTLDQLDLPLFVDTVATEAGLYLRHACGLGGTPDGLVVVDGVVCVLERKTVSDWNWRKWRGELPASYRLQGQCYCGLLGLPRVVYAVLVGGNKLERFEIEASPAVFDGICAEVVKFWQEVRDGVEPEVQGKDYDAVRAWFETVAPEQVAKHVEIDSAEALAWAEEFEAADAQYKAMEAAEDARRAVLAQGMRLFYEHQKFSIAGRKFSRVDVAPQPARMREAKAGFSYLKAGGGKKK